MARHSVFIITCEHGGKRVPESYRRWFAGHEALLAGHRGWDPGALAVARDLAEGFAAPLFFSTVSRLVIDLNRSVGHPRLYSEATRAAPPALRRELLQHYYLPYRARVEAAIGEAVAGGARVLHIASHSFTPVLDGIPRDADVGLLYDPRRAGELDLCRRWHAALAAVAPDLRVRRNYPYTGRSDGFTAYLRRRFADEAYAGVELEINQRHVGRRQWAGLRRAVLSSLLEVAGEG